MALAAVRRSNCGTGDNQKEESYEPIVFRTYDYPDDDIERDPEDTGDPLVASSTSLTAAQALAATTAIPAVVHSIKAQLFDDRDVSLMDGSLFAACPLHDPRQPFGVVLFIGMIEKTTSGIRSLKLLSV